MDNYADTNIKNRILEIPSFITANNANALATNEDSAYMEVNESVISDLIETGCLVANPSRCNCWSRGSKSKFFYDKKRVIVEANYITVKVKEFEDINIEDLNAIWMFKEDTGKYVNRLEYIMGAYMEQKRNHR